MLSKHCEKIKIKRVKEENRGGEGESSFAALADGEASWILKTTIELLSLFFFVCLCVMVEKFDRFSFLPRPSNKKI